MSPTFFKQHLTSQNLMDSDPMTLSCKVEGFNPDTMKAKWTQNKTPVPGNFEISHQGDELKLSLEEVFPEDGGLYMCEILDRSGKCLALTACTVVITSKALILSGISC